MNNYQQEQWAISRDGENFSGAIFSSYQEAVDEGMISLGGTEFSVGRCVSPTPPEDYFHTEDWLEHVSVQEDYYGDHAEGWDLSTPEQREELDVEVRAAIAAWLERHGLRPAFFNVAEIVRINKES